MDGKILDNSEPCTTTEVTHPYGHRYDTIDMPCLFGGSVKIRVASRFHLGAPLSGQESFIH